MKVNYRKKTVLEEEKNKIVKDYNKGMSLKDIIEKYGYSRATIYNVLRSEAKRLYVKEN